MMMQRTHSLSLTASFSLFVPVLLLMRNEEENDYTMHLIVFIKNSFPLRFSCFSLPSWLYASRNTSFFTERKKIDCKRKVEVKRCWMKMIFSTDYDDNERINGFYVFTASTIDTFTSFYTNTGPPLISYPYTLFSFLLFFTLLLIYSTYFLPLFS